MTQEEAVGKVHAFVSERATMPWSIKSVTYRPGDTNPGVSEYDACATWVVVINDDSDEGKKWGNVYPVVVEEESGEIYYLTPWGKG